MLINIRQDIWTTKGSMVKFEPSGVKTDAAHIFISAKRQQLELKFQQMYWILGRKSELSIENKLLIYKTILKPIWTYGIPL
jgi:hypothetical protein